MSRTRSRRPSVVVASVLAALGALGSGTADAAECWRPPVEAAVSDPFRPPACRWCPGNRGIDYASEPGVPVRAVRAGTVTFAGSVAGTGYVVVEHPDGRRATYGGVSDRRVQRGDLVLARSVIGMTAGPLHFGLRDGRRYLDPTSRFGRAVYPTRLVPLDGSTPLAVGPPRIVCGR